MPNISLFLSIRIVIFSLYVIKTRDICIGGGVGGSGTQWSKVVILLNNTHVLNCNAKRVINVNKFTISMVTCYSFTVTIVACTISCHTESSFIKVAKQSLKQYPRGRQSISMLSSRWPSWPSLS